jgi:hypothetical protein
MLFRLYLNLKLLLSVFRFFAVVIMSVLIHTVAQRNSKSFLWSSPFRGLSAQDMGVSTPRRCLAVSSDVTCRLALVNFCSLTFDCIAGPSDIRITFEETRVRARGLLQQLPEM